MSFFIAGKKSTLTVLEKGSRSPDIVGNYIEPMRAALCANYSIPDSDLSLYIVPDSSEAAINIIDGFDHTVEWSGSEIVGVSFAGELAKKYVKVTSSKSTILADNTDSTVISVEVWKADGSGIATSVTASADVPILTPDGIKKVRISVVNGTASKTFKTTKAGVWQIPYAKKRFSNFRVLSIAEFESIQDFSTM